MGELLLTDENARKLHDKYLVFLPGTHDTNGAGISDWPKNKSLRPHTQERENAVRIALTSLLITLLINADFVLSFIRYIDRVHMFFIKIDKPLTNLYRVKKVKTPDTS